MGPWQLRRGPPGYPPLAGHEKSAGGLPLSITKNFQQQKMNWISKLQKISAPKSA
jgi:hypothetical protein